MGNSPRQPVAAPQGFTYYRITAYGQAAVGERSPLRSRYHSDLLEVFQTCGRGIYEHELRQFMPPASLLSSIECLLAMGLIECDEPPPVHRRRLPGRRPVLIGAMPIAAK